MSIIKVNKTPHSYTIINNDILSNESLSWKARGLLAYMLSRPPEWKFYVKDLVKRGTDGRDAIYKILKELRSHGYVIHRFSREERGQFSEGYYDVYDTPQREDNGNPNETPHDDEGSEFDQNSHVSQSTQKNLPIEAYPYQENPITANPPIINKDIKINTETAASASKNIATNTNSKNPKKNAAVQFNLKNINRFSTAPTFTLKKSEYQWIGDQLTQGQLNEITHRVIQLNDQEFPINAEELSQEIIHTILNKRSFSHAGQDFHKKLNTIFKCIRQKQWTSPVELKSKKFKEESNQKKEIIFNWQHLHFDCQHWKRMLSTAQAKTKIDEKEIDSLQAIVSTCETKLFAYEKQYGLKQSINA